MTFLRLGSRPQTRLPHARSPRYRRQLLINTLHHFWSENHPQAVDEGVRVFRTGGCDVDGSHEGAYVVKGEVAEADCVGSGGVRCGGGDGGGEGGVEC